MGRCFWLVMLALVLGVAGVLPCAGVSAWAQSAKLSDPDALAQRLAQRETLRVIVTFKFPEYGTLLAASRSFGVVTPDAPASPATVQAQAGADQALAAAVAATATELAQQAGEADAQLLEAFQTIPSALFRVNAAGLDKLAALPQVLSIQEDRANPRPRPVGTTVAPDAPQLADTATLIGATTLWDQGYTGKDWYIAVVDDGIRNSHEMFSGKTLVEACFTTKDPDENPTASLCPNGQRTMYGTGAAKHYGSDFHGSHVAGIAAGKSDSLKGVAPDADIIAVQVFSDGQKDDEPSAYDADQLRGLEYIYSLRSTYSIAAVNMSVGGGRHSTPCTGDSLKSVIDNLRAAGIPLATSAGNDGACDKIDSPACVPGAFPVGAASKSDVIASFSDFNEDMVFLFAPGVDIKSAGADSDTTYKLDSGTSMASPHVAGAFTLLKSVKSDATVTALGNALRNTGKPVTFNRCTKPDNVNLRIQVDQAAAQLNTTPVSGQADIWWVNAGSGANKTWAMGKLHKTGETSRFSAPTQLSPVCFADFNGNGETDGLWRNKTTGVNFLVYMNKGNYVSHASFDTIAPPWQVVGCADFNSDQNVDIYWQNTDTRASGVTYLNGSGQWVGTAYGPTMPESWRVAGVGDFNQDGKPDLLAHNPGNGQTVIGLMNGVGLEKAVYVGAFDTGYSPKGTGKFTTANNVDILWRNQSLGKNVILSMNQTAFTSYTFLEDASSTEWDISGAGSFQ